MAGKISKWVSKRRVKRLAKKGKVTMKSYKGKRHEGKEKAYDKKAYELHGEFAHLNFPEDYR